MCRVKPSHTWQQRQLYPAQLYHPIKEYHERAERPRDAHSRYRSLPEALRETVAVRDISLAVGSGDIYGFHQPPTALAGCAHIRSIARRAGASDEGSIRVCGIDVVPVRGNRAPHCLCSRQPRRLQIHDREISTSPTLPTSSRCRPTCAPSASPSLPSALGSWGSHQCGGKLFSRHAPKLINSLARSCTNPGSSCSTGPSRRPRSRCPPTSSSSCSARSSLPARQRSLFSSRITRGWLKLCNKVAIIRGGELLATEALASRCWRQITRGGIPLDLAREVRASDNDGQAAHPTGNTRLLGCSHLKEDEVDEQFCFAHRLRTILAHRQFPAQAPGIEAVAHRTPRPGRRGGNRAWCLMTAYVALMGMGLVAMGLTRVIPAFALVVGSLAGVVPSRGARHALWTRRLGPC